MIDVGPEISTPAFAPTDLELGPIGDLGSSVGDNGIDIGKEAVANIGDMEDSGHQAFAFGEEDAADMAPAADPVESKIAPEPEPEFKSEPEPRADEPVRDSKPTLDRPEPVRAAPTRHAPNSSYEIWGRPQAALAKQPEVAQAKTQLALAERPEAARDPSVDWSAIDKALNGELPSDDTPASGSKPPEDSSSNRDSGGGKPERVGEPERAPAAFRINKSSDVWGTRSAQTAPAVAEPRVQTAFAEPPVETAVGAAMPEAATDELSTDIETDQAAKAEVEAEIADTMRHEHSKLTDEERIARNQRDTALVATWKGDDPEAADRAAETLIGHYDPFLRQQANRIAAKVTTQQTNEVLQQEGRLEFLRAAGEEWDPERASLIWFGGTQAIRQMNKVAATEKRALHLPLAVSQTVQKINILNHERTKQGLPALTREEITEQFDLTPDITIDPVTGEEIPAAANLVTPSAIARAEALGLTVGQEIAVAEPFEHIYDRIEDTTAPSIHSEPAEHTDQELVELRLALTQSMMATATPEQDLVTRLSHIRDMVAVALRLDGLTFREVAEELTEMSGEQITHQRVHQIYTRGMEDIVARMTDTPVRGEIWQEEELWREREKKKKGVNFLVGEHIHPAGSIENAHQRWTTPDDEQGEDFDPLQRAWLGNELGLVMPPKEATRYFTDAHIRFTDLAEKEAEPHHLRQSLLAMAYAPVLLERSQNDGNVSAGTISAVYDRIGSLIGAGGEEGAATSNPEGWQKLIMKASIAEIYIYARNFYGTYQRQPGGPDHFKRRKYVTLPNGLKVGVETGVLGKLPTEEQAAPQQRKARAGVYAAHVTLPKASAEGTHMITTVVGQPVLSKPEREFLKDSSRLVQFDVNRYGHTQQTRQR